MDNKMTKKKNKKMNKKMTNQMNAYVAKLLIFIQTRS